MHVEDNELTWHCKHFTQLTAGEIYDILQLRSEVFVVEQQCIFLDIDGVDKISYHLFGYRNGQLVACCRLIGKDISYENRTSIGRVANSLAVRGSGVGRVMLNKAIDKCRELFGDTTIKIGAQLYLKNWYGSFGFISCDDVYLEDGIEHVHMELS